jgi:hypothetical protein
VYREVYNTAERSLEKLKMECKDMGACSNPLYFQGAMGQYYPR